MQQRNYLTDDGVNAYGPAKRLGQQKRQNLCVFAPIKSRRVANVSSPIEIKTSIDVKAKCMTKPTNILQMHNKLDVDVRVMRFEDLKNCDTLDKAWGPTKAMALLWRNEENKMGHWICVFRRNNEIIYFDSLGLNANHDDTQHGYLWKLTQGKDNVTFDSAKLQSSRTLTGYMGRKHGKRPIATCGPWVVERLKFRDLPKTVFASRYKSIRSARDLYVSVHFWLPKEQAEKYMIKEFETLDAKTERKYWKQIAEYYQDSE